MMKMKKRKLNYNKNFKLTIIFILFAMFMLNASTIFMFKFIAYDNNYMSSATYNKKALDNMDENITKIIGNYCSYYTSSISKAQCVQDFVINSNSFNYTKTNDVILSDELMKKGGDCKSWTTFYKAIFDYMDLKNNYIYSENHVYLNVYDDTFYCNVDQLSIDCHMFGDSE